MKRYPVLHPPLFAAYSVLAVFAFNYVRIPLVQPARALLLVVAGAIILLLILRTIVKDWDYAGLLTTLCIFAFLYYGHIYRQTQTLLGGLPVPAQHLIVFGLWVLFLSVVGSRRTWQWLHAPQTITGFLNLVSVGALAFPLRVILTLVMLLNRDPLTGWTRPVNADEDGYRLTGDRRPDIYYIIADSYGRADILQDIYHFDNSEFLQFLTSRGFYVAAEGRSNYVQTELSLASSLNFEYINYLAVGKDTVNWIPLRNLIENSRVRTLLQDFGYTTVSFSTGYLPTDLKDADVYLSPYASVFNEFEEMWLATTGAQILKDIGVLKLPVLGYESRRERIIYTFSQLADDRLISLTPKFVFVHIIAPHPPFAFDRNGNPIDPNRPYLDQDKKARSRTMFAGIPSNSSTSTQCWKRWLTQYSQIHKRLRSSSCKRITGRARFWIGM